MSPDNAQFLQESHERLTHSPRLHTPNTASENAPMSTSDKKPPSESTPPDTEMLSEMDDGPPALMIAEETSAPTPEETLAAAPSPPAETSEMSAAPARTPPTPMASAAGTPPPVETQTQSESAPASPAPALTPPPMLQPQEPSKTPQTPVTSPQMSAPPILSLAAPASPTPGPSGAPSLDPALSNPTSSLAPSVASQTLDAAPLLSPIAPKPVQTQTQTQTQTTMSKMPSSAIGIATPTAPPLAPQTSAPTSTPTPRPKARVRRPRQPKVQQPPPSQVPPVMLPSNQGTQQVFNQISDPNQMASILNMLYANKTPQMATLPGHVKIAPRPPKWPAPAYNMPMNMQMNMQMNMAQFCGTSTSFSGFDMQNLITPQHAQQPQQPMQQQTYQVQVPVQAPPVLVPANQEQRRGPTITEMDENEADGPPRLTSEIEDEVNFAKVSTESCTALSFEAAVNKGSQTEYPIYHYIDGLVIEEGPKPFKFDDQLSDIDDFENEEPDSEIEEAAITTALVQALESSLNIRVTSRPAQVLQENPQPGPSNVVISPQQPVASSTPVAVKSSPAEKKIPDAATSSKKRSPLNKEREKKKENPPIIKETPKEKVRKRRSKKVDEIQKLLNMDFGPGEAPFNSTSKEEYVKEMKKRESQKDLTPRRAAALAANKNISLESQDGEEGSQQPKNSEEPPPKRAAALAANKTFESLGADLERELEEQEVMNPTDLRTPPRADQPSTSGMPRSAFDIPTETYCLNCRKSLSHGCYHRHPQYCSKPCRKLYRRSSAVLRRQSDHESHPVTSPRSPRAPVMPVLMKNSPPSPLPSPPHPLMSDLEAAPLLGPVVPQADLPGPSRQVAGPSRQVAPEAAPQPGLAPVPQAPRAAPPAAPTPAPPEAPKQSKINVDEAMVWDVEQVAAFIQQITQSEACATIFRDHLVDGRALLLLANEPIDTIPLKLGPRIKIQNIYAEIRPQLKGKSLSSIQNRSPAIDEIMQKRVEDWTQDNAELWISTVTSSPEIGLYFRSEEVDGPTLLHPDVEVELSSKFSDKRGPWLNLKNALSELKKSKE
ncbi:hypothetical protein L596_016593 [Steinernema carpocapsae]|uniref:SAM domain-containing protein n=1 Tax=Steinernema carpocapsae TaxID=34508 RepID=A0A4U5NJA3_STECR|nr:hypothetical protein L596_016593 [Steinernema carpocapsae]